MNFCQQKNAFLAPKGAILGNRGHKTAPRAAEWAPTGKLKVSKVTSGYGEVMVPLNRVRLSARKGGYMGVALKKSDFLPLFGPKIGPDAPQEPALQHGQHKKVVIFVSRHDVETSKNVWEVLKQK